MKITSVNNNLIKEISKLLKSKYREDSGLFLVEGEKAVKEAFESGLEIVNLFVLEGEDYFAKFDYIEVSGPVMSKITDAKSAPKIVAVAKQPKYNIDSIKNANKIILLENIKDAGNLGTIIRTAVAFNIDGIILFGDTVDLYNPKCVRSAVGNLWKLPIIKLKDLKVLKSQFQDFEKVATLPLNNNSVCLKDYNPTNKMLIMFGSEADGLSDSLKGLATKNLTIEMSSNVESLNLSISVALVVYKILVK